MERNNLRFSHSAYYSGGKIGIFIPQAEGQVRPLTLSWVNSVFDPTSMGKYLVQTVFSVRLKHVNPLKNYFASIQKV